MSNQFNFATSSKSFVTSWKLYLDSLSALPLPDKLDWRLTLILHYLAQFEEPLFRKVEEAPAFYSDHIVKFCRTGFNSHPLFDGLENPYEMSKSNDDDKGGLGASTTTSSSSSSAEAINNASKPSPHPRIFWISRLVTQLAKDTSLIIDDEVMHNHLLQSGGKWIAPAEE